MNLYDEIDKVLNERNGNDGYEYKRTGGSGGKTEYSPDLLKWMHSNKKIPRRSKGIKFVKTETKWLCYYIGAREKSCVLQMSTKTYHNKI